MGTFSGLQIRHAQWPQRLGAGTTNTRIRAPKWGTLEGPLRPEGKAISKKTKTTSSETKTVTPTNPQWVTDGAQGLSQTIMNLGTKDPSSYIAGADPLQTQAAQGAAGLSVSPLYGQAADIFGKVAGAGANTYNPTTYGAAGYNPGSYNATTYGAAGYDPGSYKASEYTGSGYDATLGQASSMQAASLLDGLQNYMSPYTKDVVDTTLADFDQNAGQQQAQAALEEARSGAFGGSGAAITRSMLGDSLARARASTAAGLRDQAFNTGAGLSATDAGFRQQANLTNATLAQQMAMANAAAQNQASMFGADARNQSSQFNAGARNQAGQFNTDAANQAAQFLAGAQNQAGQFNAGSLNQAGQFNTDAANQANQFYANANNQAGQFNAGALNQAGQFNAGAQDTALSRLFQAGQGLAGLGSQQGADQRANIALQGDLGAQLRQIAQSKAGADIALAGAQTGMFGSLPLNLFRGENSTGTMTKTESSSDPMGGLTTLAGLALAPFTGGASVLGSLGSMFGGGASALNKAGQAAKNIGG